MNAVVALALSTAITVVGDGIPSPLCIGTVALEDGTQARGFLCEAHATKGARDITSLGGWRRFIQGGTP